MCVTQNENSNEPVYNTCLDLDEVVRLTRASLQPDKTVETDPVVEVENEDSDEASLYFLKKR